MCICHLVLSHKFEVRSTVFCSLLMHLTEMVQSLAVGHVRGCRCRGGLEVGDDDVGSDLTAFGAISPSKGRSGVVLCSLSPLSPEHSLAARGG